MVEIWKRFGMEAAFFGNVVKEGSAMFQWNAGGKKNMFSVVFPFGSYGIEEMNLQNWWNKDFWDYVSMKTGEKVFDIAEDILDLVNIAADLYKTEDIALPIGDKFSFFDAETNFELMDSIMEALQHYAPGIDFFYSTPHRFLNSLRIEKGDNY